MKRHSRYPPPPPPSRIVVPPKRQKTVFRKLFRAHSNEPWMRYEWIGVCAPKPTKRRSAHARIGVQDGVGSLACEVMGMAVCMVAF